jgi:hypothetical protein
MSKTVVALSLVLPFAGVFAYAAWHEWRRRRSDGPGTYGLAYDPETDTTHVTLLDEGETGFDPEAERMAENEDAPDM